jgi:hypothetical protein
MREVLLGQAPASEFVHAGVSVSGRQARFCVVAANPAGRRLPGARFEVRGHVAAQAIADSRGVATAAAPVRRIVGPRRTPRRVTVRFTWTGGQKDVRVRVRP